MSNFKTVFLDIGDTLVTNGGWVAGAREALQALSYSHIRLGLISNTGDWTRAELKQRLPADFDFSIFQPELVLLSSELQIEKPKIEIFFLAMHRSGDQPWEIVFVGESIKESLAAQAAGIRSLRLAADYPQDFRELPSLLGL